MEATPRLTLHARERCAEMGISTKRAKRVVKERRLVYISNLDHDNDAFVVMSDDPDICVVWKEHTNLILTVLPRTQEEYVR
jgi:hypothetical protein